jgi:signal transduction histidine kinase/CheY-like chemotaxis protein
MTTAPESNNYTSMDAALLRWLHEFSVQGILITDDKLGIRSCNDWLQRQIGKKEHDLVGGSLLEIFPELKSRGFDRYYVDALNGQSRILSHRLHKYLLAMPPSAGSGLFAQMQQSARISPLLDGEKIIGTITVIEDVTERVVREMELSSQIEERERLLDSELEARKLAEANSRVKDEFLAAVSHEIRAPLNAITGWTQLLLSGDLDEEKSQHALDTIRRNVTAQAHIIEDLLDISRIVAGQMRLDMQALNLTEAVRTAIENVSPSAKAKNVQLVAPPQERPVFVMGDGGRMQQILWNLLLNAVKFTPAGGHVEVSLGEVGGFAELTVRDTGQGIEPDFLPYVFDRFRQAEGGSRRRQGGLGLGLSIVKNLVEMHGGVITADSRGEGCGTVFTVMLPSLALEIDAAAGGRNEEQGLQGSDADISGCRILIVEDDRDSREMLAVLLNAHHAETMTAADAVDALDKLPSFRPDVLISDLGMPDVDGYDLIRRIRSMSPERGGRIPAIALTGYAGPEEAKRVYSAGYDSHLPKPVDQEKLISTISSMCRAEQS